ncbi:MAG: hypothetical protein JXR83_11615 [Deltaproteobacteria bacterium]|nr:hypothetical protein [Deltaproteobacteria bacterium]
MGRRGAWRWWATLLGAAAIVALWLGPAAAQTQKRKKIVLSEFVIEGRVQKPQAFLLLQRQNLNFEGLELKRSFVPKIIKSVDKDPF